MNIIGHLECYHRSGHIYHNNKSTVTKLSQLIKHSLISFRVLCASGKSNASAYESSLINYY